VNAGSQNLHYHQEQLKKATWPHHKAVFLSVSLKRRPQSRKKESKSYKKKEEKKRKKEEEEAKSREHEGVHPTELV
jgi:hypothetical protein